jgi:hypothetical protein
LDRSIDVLDSDAQWVACLVDTEGCIGLTRGALSQDGRGLYIEVGNTNEEILLIAQRIVGGLGKVYSRGTRGDPRRREVFRWCLGSKQAALVLQRIRPFLVIKQRQADLALYYESLKTGICSPGYKKTLDPEIQSHRDKMYNLMRLLNSKDHLSADMSWVPEFQENFSPDMWSIPYRTKPNKQKNAHPAQFPEDLVDNCLALADLSPDQIVLDPFAGSCGAAEPCFRRGLRFLGVEICPVYAEQSQVDLMALSALYSEEEQEDV